MTTIWKLPYTSSSGTESVLEDRDGRTLAIILIAPFDGDDTPATVSLLFRDVAIYQTTFLPALRPEISGPAYDSLIDVGDTEWLRQVAPTSQRFDGTTRRHFRISMGVDGPCYDVIAASVEIVEEKRLYLVRALEWFLEEPTDSNASSLYAVARTWATDSDVARELCRTLREFFPSIGPVRITQRELIDAAQRAYAALTR